MRLKYFALFGVILLLASCSVPPKTTPLSSVQKPTQQWQAKGRLAAKQGSKGGNASFIWQQQGSSYVVRLFGPFGSGGVTIKSYPHFIELTEANGKVTRANTPENLMQKIAGWQVPLSGLQYWLKATPIPNIPSEKQLDQQGRLLFLAQQGWKIYYDRYHDDSLLPSKLHLENNDVYLKMVITSWSAL
jgi:outer membrane lipoprotein LolB